MALTPRPAERVGDDDGDRRPHAVGDLAADTRGRGVWIDGQEHDGVGRPRVRAIDTRVRANEAMTRLADQHAALPANDLLRLGEHDLELAGVLPRLAGHLEGARAGNDVGEMDHAALALRNHLLGHDQHVVVAKA